MIAKNHRNLCREINIGQQLKYHHTESLYINQVLLLMAFFTPNRFKDYCNDMFDDVFITMTFICIN